ncbi:8-oxo-dGTP diphosphatase [Novipirellula artificiosorum]|uniref:8-oxo-dGTP diphosphatase n=2 Tax=Novipirellula artificiosorum TaxID=2528016 RepID=A0A5C6DK10_9BACT|nr:8-oxo-dGTP diphosphatase [Novipirellula artificiosorum]
MAATVDVNTLLGRVGYAEDVDPRRILDSLPPMRPALAYGRHRGPWRRGARQAAVAISLFQDTQCQWSIPLTRRPMGLRHHGGQICLPGGQIEPGERPQQAALREFEEELGVSPDVLTYFGELPRQYVYASDNVVRPVVFAMRMPSTDWVPDPIEVDEVILLPLEELFRHESRVSKPVRRKVVIANAELRETDPNATLQFPAPAFQWGGNRIWGATAIILDDLAQMLLRSQSLGWTTATSGTPN